MGRKANVQEYRQKWGIPDWRDETAYPASLPDALWRWEFLRRRDDYRRDWKQCYPATVKWYQDHKFIEAFTAEAPGDGRTFFDNWCNGPDSPRFRAHLKGSVGKYGLTGLINPAIARPQGGAYSPMKPVQYVFDGNCPLEEQIRACKKGLGLLKRCGLFPSTQRKRRTEWRRYLRVLDAKAVGATNREIWQVITKGQLANNPYSRGRDLVRAAENLRNKLPA